MIALRHTSLAIASALVSRGAPFFALAICAHLLSAEEFGAFAIATVAVNLLMAVVSGGGDLWLNRFAWEKRQGFRAGTPIIRVYLQISALIAVLVLAGTAIIASATPFAPGWTGVVVATGLTAATAGFAETVFAVLRKHGRVPTFFVLRDLGAPLGYIALLLVIAPETAATAVLMMGVAAALALAAGVAVLLRDEPAHGAGGGSAGKLWRWRGRRFLAHTARLVAGNFCARLAAAIDIFVLGMLVGAATVGEYRVAAQLALGFVVVQHFVFLGLPHELRIPGNQVEAAARVSEVRHRHLMVAGSSLVALAGLAVLAEPILRLFGPRFVEVGPILQLLLLIRYLNLLWGPQHQLLISNGYILNDAAAYLWTAVVWLVGFGGGLLLVQPLYAAVLGHALGSLAGHGYRARLLRQFPAEWASIGWLPTPLLAVSYLAPATAAIVLSS